MSPRILDHLTDTIPLTHDVGGSRGNALIRESYTY